jgi:hypothetical protein
MTKRDKQRGRRSTAVHNKSVDVLTVGWMLMVFTTLACEVLAGVAHFYVTGFDRQAKGVELLSSMLLFAAFVVGLLSLIVGAVVVHSRRTTPPRSIVVFAVIVALAPLAAMLLVVS